MNARSLLGLIALFATVTVGVWVAQLNEAPVTLDLPGLAPLTAPLWVVLFLSLLCGFLLALLYSLVLSSRDALVSRRQERAARPARERAARLDQGLRLLLAGQDGEARELLGRVAREEPGNADAWLHAGVAARRLGDAASAQQEHLRALGLRPEDPAVLDELSRDAEALGDLPAAVRYLQEAIEHGGDSLARRRRLRDLHLRAGRWEAAIRAQEALVATAAEEQERRHEAATLRGMRVGKGRRALEAREPRAAADIGRALLAEEPDYEPGHALLVDALLEGDDPDTALDALAEAVSRTGSLELLRRQGNLLVDLEEPERAIRTLRAAIESFDGAPRLAARILLGRLYYRLELIDEALSEFRAAAEAVEFSPVVNYYLAKLYARRGEHREAHELLKKTLRLSRFLDFRYRCPECGTVGPEYGRRCHDLCPTGTVEMQVARDASPARPVEAPAI